MKFLMCFVVIAASFVCCDVQAGVGTPAMQQRQETRQTLRQARRAKVFGVVKNRRTRRVNRRINVVANVQDRRAERNLNRAVRLEEKANNTYSRSR